MTALRGEGRRRWRRCPFLTQVGRKYDVGPAEMGLVTGRMWMPRRDCREVRESGVLEKARVVARVVLTAIVAVLCCSIVVGCADSLSEARDLEAGNDWNGALAVYQEVLEGEPDNIEALSGAAVALQLLGRFDDALSYQELVVEKDPTDVLTRIELGFNYLNHQDRPYDAASVMAEAVELEPSAKHHVFLAQALEAAGDLDGAEESLREATVVDPGYGYAYAQLIDLLEQQDRKQEADVVRTEATSQGIVLQAGES